jgi:signal transduction histidine kinase
MDRIHVIDSRMRNPSPRPVPVQIAITFVIVLVVGLADYFSGYEISFSIFYLLPISFALWKLGTPFAVLVAGLSIASWLLGDWGAGVTYPNQFVPVWNASITFGFYLVVIRLLSRVKSFQQTLENRVRQRTAALAAEIEKRQQLEKEILIISEREQQRIGHDLHDTLCQHLTGTAIAGQVLGEKLAAESRPEVEDANHIVELVEQGIEIARNLARGLFPVEIEAEGLISALRELAARHDGRSGIDCRFEAEDPALIHDAFVAAHLYRIGQEAVSNAARHSGARHIVVSLTRQEDRGARLVIKDDGSGIAKHSRASKGMGLHIMRHRAGMIGASFDIQSDSHGTVVSCRVANQAETKVG